MTILTKTLIMLILLLLGALFLFLFFMRDWKAAMGKEEEKDEIDNFDFWIDDD